MRATKPTPASWPAPLPGDPMTLTHALFGLALAVTVGCGTPGLGDAGLLPGRGLPDEGAVLLMEPADARDADDRVISGSASSVTVALRHDLEARGFDLFVADGRGKAKALREAAELDCALVLEAEVLGWAEAGLDWREQPDRVELRLSLWSVPDGELLAWGHGEREGGSVADKLNTAHRLLEPLAHDLLEPMFRGTELSGPPESED